MEHYYQGIAGWFDFEDIYRGAVATAESGAVLVEVGCWEGKSLAFLGVEAINSGKMLRVIGVDHFLGSAEHQERKSLDGLAERCRKNLEPCGAAVKIWQRRPENRHKPLCWSAAGIVITMSQEK